jgi:peptidoglycan/xylan/chitin deacetylase (PgdA/CDA1 family)
VGVDADLIDQWEWEEALPADAHIDRLASVLGVPPADLTPPEIVIDILPPEPASLRPADPFATDPAVAHAIDPLPPVREQLSSAWGGIKRFFKDRVEPGAGRPSEPDEAETHASEPVADLRAAEPVVDLTVAATYGSTGEAAPLVEDHPRPPRPASPPPPAIRAAPPPPPHQPPAPAAPEPAARHSAPPSAPPGTRPPEIDRPVPPPPAPAVVRRPALVERAPAEEEAGEGATATELRPKWLSYLIGVLAVLIVAAAAGGGVYALLAGERDQLGSDLEGARADIAALTAEQAALVERIGELEAAVVSEQERADRAEETVREELAPVIEENDRLQRRNGALREENELLRKAIVVSSASDEFDLVALTIDDGGSDVATEFVLDTLAAKGVTATILPTGAAVEAQPNLYRRAVRDGHELGNHTVAHIGVTDLTTDELRAEIEGWQTAVDEALGRHYDAKWFRPPFMDGFTDLRGPDEVRQVLAESGLITALWDVETFYALYSAYGPQLAGPSPDAGDVADYVVRSAGPGSIVLLHFGPLDVAALPGIIDGLRAKGLEPVSLTQLIEAQTEVLGAEEASTDA